MDEPYYRRDLSLIHHRGFGFHADMCAPGILRLLEPVRERGGLVLEIGCGSGLLTRHLVDAGHRVVATDASPAMLDLARETAPGANVRVAVLPDDPLPDADAVVGVGHALNYLSDAAAIERGLLAIGRALRPGGVLALDLCDLEWARARGPDAAPRGWVGDDWALVTEFSVPAPDRFVRQMATFVRQDDGSWRRGDERHENVLIDTARVPALLAGVGVEASVRESFGGEELPAGLRAVVGTAAR
ncbi:MAG TPA: class I SAM-dependent methyltransferase [Gaiellales bacterium]|nr:class I SAM-dependent methyltransferase [Gaiellales bacterium]